MQWVDIDMYSGKALSRNPHEGRSIPGASAGPVPVIRLFGVTGNGNSVLMHVHGVTPYFYCSVPYGFKNTPAVVGAFREGLNAAVESRKRGGEVCPAYVLAVEVVDKQSILGYHEDKMSQFFKVYVALPNYVPTAKSALQSGFSFLDYSSQQYHCYEANVPFVLRFMIDNDVSGGNWLEAPAGTYSKRESSQHVSHSQLEIDIYYNSLISHKPDGEWMKIAPFRILSFDIECQGRKGFFPEAEKDSVIQIGNIVTEYGIKGAPPVAKNIFVMNTCSAIVGADVYSFKDEGKMLVAWSEFVREVDADIITGYNVQNFDIPYLLNRAKALKCDETFSLWGRIIGLKSKMKESTFQSSAFGKRENIDTSIVGRVTFDMIAYMRRNHKLSSYSLNAVSTEFLGKQKEDVHHSIISDLQQGSEDDRRRLAVYCLKDACLPLELMDKLMVLVNHVEMARVTGVPLNYLLTRGQQIKVVSMIYREAMKHNLIVPTIERRGGGGDEVGFEGATVIEPKKGYYDIPIATLDFASLYPSIMQAHNLCYTTLIANQDVHKYPSEHYEKTPCGNYFIRATVKKGILPTILDSLLSARKRAKADMKKATDPDVIAVQNGRQLALKISANSVYGFTGATVGQLPCLAISSSVTAFGREMIDTTAAAVEKKYTIENGYSANAVVIYGDTDSVMVKFGVTEVAEAMKLGLEAATEISKLFPPPVKLEFEKVYFPYLLMNKKRYAGLYWTNPHKHDKLDAKGIETVRRDNCLLVRKVVSTSLTKILLERNIAGAVQYVKDTISDLLQNKMDISMLVITKALSKSVGDDDYKAKTAHVELAERMRKRDPGSAPVIGDRVPYVIIEAAKGTPAFKKSEDPVYVLENR
jgi:DNA polymerase delta subunit 1